MKLMRICPKSLVVATIGGIFMLLSGQAVSEVDATTSAGSSCGAVAQAKNSPDCSLNPNNPDCWATPTQGSFSCQGGPVALCTQNR